MFSQALLLITSLPKHFVSVPPSPPSLNTTCPPPSNTSYLPYLRQELWLSCVSCLSLLDVLQSLAHYSNTAQAVRPELVHPLRSQEVT